MWNPGDMRSRRILAVVAATLVCAASLLARPQQPDDVTLVLKGPAASLEGLVVWRQPPEREAEMVAAGTARGSGSDTLSVSVACGLRIRRLLPAFLLPHPAMFPQVTGAPSSCPEKGQRRQ